MVDLGGVRVVVMVEGVGLAVGRGRDMKSRGKAFEPEFQA